MIHCRFGYAGNFPSGDIIIPFSTNQINEYPLFVDFFCKAYGIVTIETYSLASDRIGNR